jgi:hypothetical protein
VLLKMKSICHKLIKHLRLPNISSHKVIFQKWLSNNIGIYYIYNILCKGRLFFFCEKKIKNGTWPIVNYFLTSFILYVNKYLNESSPYYLDAFITELYPKVVKNNRCLKKFSSITWILLVILFFRSVKCEKLILLLFWNCCSHSVALSMNVSSSICNL